MAFVRFASFHLNLERSQAAHWFMTRIGVLIGCAISYPMNWWSIRGGIDETM